MQTWSELTAGSAIYTNPELSRKTRFVSAKQVRCHEAVDNATEFNLGKKSGDKVGFSLTGRMSTLSTTPLGEGTPVPLDAPPIYEGTGTVYRYARGINWTGTRADLDRIDVEDRNIRVLREHSARSLNSIIYTALKAAASFAYVATSAVGGVFTTNGTPSGTATEDMTAEHLRNVAKNLETVNMPYYDGEQWLMICSTTNKYGILSDTAANGFVDVKKYASGGAEGILNNEFGSAFGFRFIHDNDVLINDTGTNNFGESIIVGYEALKEILVYPVHFRANLNFGNDFGNQAALAWQGMFGFKAPWNYTTHTDGRICLYSSAA